MLSNNSLSFYKDSVFPLNTGICETLDKLYWRSKNERRAGFVDIAELVEKHKEENIEGADE